MSKLTIVGDPHITNKSLDKAEILFDLVEKQGNETVWLGDFLDTKEVIRGKCLNLLYDKLKNSKLVHRILIGNHDWFNLECKDHALQVLKELKNVIIVDKCCYDPGGIGYLPYIHDQKELKSKFKMLEDNFVKAVFAHLDVVGFDYGNGFMCETGLSLKHLKNFKKVISGHFHKQQIRDNLVYVGTPFSHSFGESNQDKYIAIFDTETLNLEYIPTPFPKHITVEINCDSIELEDNRLQNNKFDIVRVVLKGSNENITKFKLNNIFPDGFKVIERPSDQFGNYETIDETIDNKSKFKVWAKDIKGLDQQTIDLGIEILGSVND